VVSLSAENAHARTELRECGVPFGSDVADGEPVYLNPAAMARHLHILGPPGRGKTRLLFSLFQSLCFWPTASVVVINPKGNFCSLARDFLIARGMQRRIVWLDLGDSTGTLGYNPMQPNGMSIAAQAKSVRESIRAGSAQADFDQTQQLGRFLFLALLLARTAGGGLVEALGLLQPGSRLRREVLPRIADPVVREQFAYFDGLSAARQEQLAASSVARLLSFVADPVIRRMLTHTPAVDLAQVLANGQVLFVNLEINRPLRIDDVKLVGRFIVNDVINHVFERPPEKQTPVFLMMDEAELFATSDLCNVLDMGREINLWGIFAHQHLGQLRDEDKSGYLYDSMLNCARTRCVFGGLSVEQMEPLVKELALDEFDPRIEKDVFTLLELDPQESTRAIHGKTTGLQVSLARNSSTAQGTHRGRQWGSSAATTHSNAYLSGSGSTGGTGMSSGETMLPSGDIVTGFHETTIATDSDFSSESISDSESYASHKSESEGESTIRQKGTAVAVSPSLSASETVVPFYEYEKRRNVTGRAYVSPEEYYMLALQKIRRQDDRHFVLKCEHHPAVFCEAPFAPDPQLAPSRRVQALAELFANPIYAKPEDSPAETSLQPPPAAVELPQQPSRDQGDDPWQK
jgi:hypothetical protein